VIAVAAAGMLVVRGGERTVTLEHPIDPKQQTELVFPDRSHWLQPWRAYLDTQPASRLTRAVGINFDVEPGEADATARLLAANGFKRARIEIGWRSVGFDQPGKIEDGGSAHALLAALKKHGLRPLILLNANQIAPGPTKQLELTLAEPAQKGARTLRLDRGSAEAAEPGRTGLNRSSDGKAADVILTSIAPDGTARLSKPLPADLAAGPHPAATLRFLPFEPPQKPDGSPNPAFERTMHGWLRYVGAVTAEARRVLGGDDFDVEIWNELSFGSDFLYADRYFDPAPKGKGDVTQVMLTRTLAWLRDPAHGVPRVGVTNGFASQTPFPAGSTSPPGLTALSKHPYQQLIRFPAGALETAQRPLDAQGRPEGRKVGGHSWRDDFVPTYDAFFPEYYLSGIQTETMIRDISPIRTVFAGAAHGRATRPKGGAPPQVWITETGLDPRGADPNRRGSPRHTSLADASPGEVARFRAKATTRALVAYVNKGATAIDFFAVKDPIYGLVDPGFFKALKRSPGTYPGDGAGGETLAAVRRITAVMSSSRPPGRTRPLKLISVSDHHGHKQFDGDGSAAHPPLYDRDVVAFLPFQAAPGRYVVPVYVMTRNLAKELPPEDFRLSIGGLGGGELRVAASDPLTGKKTPAEVVSQDAKSVVVELPLTDSPRLLTLERR
jgi:hypothetical protein